MHSGKPARSCSAEQGRIPRVRRPGWLMTSSSCCPEPGRSRGRRGTQTPRRPRRRPVVGRTRCVLPEGPSGHRGRNRLRTETGQGPGRSDSTAWEMRSSLRGGEARSHRISSRPSGDSSVPRPSASGRTGRKGFEGSGRTGPSVTCPCAPTPWGRPAKEVLFSSNVLLTVPPEGVQPSELGLREEIRQGTRARPQGRAGLLVRPPRSDRDRTREERDPSRPERALGHARLREETRHRGP